MKELDPLVLEDLSPAQQREWAARLALLIRNRQDNRVENHYTKNETMLWNTLCEVIPEHRRRNMDDFVTNFGQRRYRECSITLDNLLTKAGVVGGRANVREAIRVQALKSLADWLRRGNIAVTGSKLLSAFDHLEHALNQDFPGYVDAKLLSRIVKVL